MVFTNDLIKNISILPKVLINIIKEYMPKMTSVFLSKSAYLENHELIRKYIRGGQTENYIRTMVRQDNDFVLGKLITENCERWLKMTSYYYKEYTYVNYLFFLEDYSFMNGSTKCYELLRRKNPRKNNIKRI
jgi:hypothetical protein